MSGADRRELRRGHLQYLKPVYEGMVNKVDLTKQDIMQYLRTVGLLEWNIHSINNDIENLNNEKQQLFIKRSFEKQQFHPLSFCLHAFFMSLLISVLIGIVSLIIWGKITSNILRTLFPSLSNVTADEAPLIAILFDCLWFIPPIVLILFLLRRSKGWALLYGYIKNKKNNVVNSKDFAKQENQRLSDATIQDADLEYQITCLTNLANKMDYELQQAYDLNIIHYKYRNLQAVCALYEYFEAGSVDTFKEAINKYDSESRLDHISAQLNDLRQGINRIYDEMLYQSQLAEQNNNLARQQLEYSRITAKNTQQIALNTKITAFNTSVLLLIEERKAHYRGY